MVPPCMLVSLIVFCPHLKKRLGVLADRADLRGLGAHDQVAAVAALPQGDAALFKDGLGLHVLQKCTVALLVGLFDGGNPPELGSQGGKALFLGFLCHPVMHIRPLVVLTLGGMEQVLLHRAQLTQSLEPQLGVLLLVLGGLQEQSGDLLVAGLLGYRGEVGVLIPGLGLPGKGFPQILLGFGRGVGVFLLIFHGKFLRLR